MNSPIITIAKKELQSFFNSPLAYLFLDVFLLLSSWFFFQNYFLIGQASMRGFFSFMPWFFLFLIPAITMRSWAEERKLGTDELLLTMPVAESSLVFGKFLASAAILGISLLLSFLIPIIVGWSGDPDLGLIFASYLGTFLFGLSSIAIGLFLSATTDNQIIAFILTLAITFLVFLIGDFFVLQNLPSFLVPLFRFFGSGTHFDGLARGVLDTRDMLYFISVIGLFLFLNIRILFRKRG